MDLEVSIDHNSDSTIERDLFSSSENPKSDLADFINYLKKETRWKQSWSDEIQKGFSPIWSKVQDEFSDSDLNKFIKEIKAEDKLKGFGKAKIDLLKKYFRSYCSIEVDV